MPLQRKSDLNKTVAQQLIKEKKFCPSVHCSYYSLLQFTKYILDSKFRFSYEEQDSETKQNNSHDIILNKILENIVDIPKKNTFRTNFTKLKRYRVISDYSTKSINEDKAKEAHRLCCNQINILNNV